ncbi:hypothetical protein LOAG_10032 [Loa loa]|uniref:Uncharacterized protein n=1 Tax=Loa loa TaxID=7209 RepID=A0A1S0TR83_LOALO|nr:hypothetical protein LOAG_10032 [Loa loa]EFO18463.1 hypothetical protein LOAG_10032 [Loa loa]
MDVSLNSSRDDYEQPFQLKENKLFRKQKCTLESLPLLQTERAISLLKDEMFEYRKQEMSDALLICGSGRRDIRFGRHEMNGGIALESKILPVLLFHPLYNNDAAY